MQTSTSSIAKQLFQMTWPMLFGVLSLMSFQLIDSAFIGQLGVLPLAAQGFTMPIQMVIIGIQVGLGIATTAVISRAIGAGKTQYAKQLGGLVIVIGGIGVALIALVLYLLRQPLLGLLGAPETVFAIIDNYWLWWLTSAWTGAMLYFYYSVCRANGNTLLPGTMMMVTSVLNLILDPIFIFTFDLGIDGAAIATIIAFGIGIAIVAPKVAQRQWTSYQWQDLNISQSLTALGHIMGPAMLSQLLPPISSMFATKLLASFGTATVAAWALGSRVEFFALVAVLAMTMSLPPMIGRMLGAKEITHIRQLVRIACQFVLGFQLLIALVTYVFATPLAELMTSETEVSQILNLHLVIVPISLGALGICMLMVSVANALGKSYLALIISALRLFAFYIPCLWIGAHFYAIKGLFIGVLVGNIIAGWAAWLAYQKALRQLEGTYLTSAQV